MERVQPFGSNNIFSHLLTFPSLVISISRKLIINIFSFLIFLYFFNFFFSSQFKIVPLFFHLISTCLTTRTLNTNIDVSNCLFKSFYFGTSGGVIYINTNNFKIQINESTFYECISGGIGGAIYSTTNGETLIYKICVLFCKGSNGQFAYFQTSANQILDFMTLSNCYNISTIGYTAIGLNGGRQNFSNINISYNSVIAQSGINIMNPIYLSLNYCTFYNNTVSATRCLYFTAGQGILSSLNFIGNNSPNPGIICVTSSGSYSMNGCIFDKNKDVLLWIATGSLTFNDCYINHFESNITSGTPATYNPTLLISISNYINHDIYNTHYCSTIPLPTIESTLNPTISNSLSPSISENKSSSSDVGTTILVFSLGVIIIFVIYFAYNHLYKKEEKSEKADTV